MTNIYLVFSEKPAQLSMDEFHRWYTAHAQENIESPGFVSAQRFRIHEVVDRQRTANEQHLALYHYDGDMSEWRTDLTRRVQTGDIVLPEFHKDCNFRSWDCEPVGDLLTPQTR